MMLMHVSTNKYEYSVRLVDKLSNQILAKDEEFKNTKGFLNKIKLKLQLRKLYKEIYIHGNNVFSYEYNKAKRNNY